MILQQILHTTAERLVAQKRFIPLDKVIAASSELEINTNFPFERALRQQKLAFICEVKKASPSKGVIAEQFPYLNIAQEYEAAGAAAISVLTEPNYFLGSDEYLSEIARTVSIPVLRKDFIIDEYMIYEAKCLGAAAVLLICAALSAEQLRAYIELAHSLGMSALVEAHTAAEIEMALQAGARIVGVNNRDLKTFKVDINISKELIKLVPPEVLFVSESGIKTAADVQELRTMGANAVLIGETLMLAADKKAALATLKGDEHD